MGVKRVVSGPDDIVWKPIAKDKGVDVVLHVPRLVFVEAEDDDRLVVVETLVLKQREEPVLDEVGGEVGSRVVSVVDLYLCLAWKKIGR